MRECITHHYACDCREKKFRQLEKELAEARKQIADLKDEKDNNDIDFGNLHAEIKRLREIIEQGGEI